MKTIGIQIEGSTYIICVLEETSSGIKLLGESKKLSLKDHLDCNEVKNLQQELFLTFDALQPDRIGYIARQHKVRRGQNPPSALSFKLEGLLQLYTKKDVEAIWPISVSSFLKKNPISGLSKYNYQEKATNLAYYLLKK